jgi:hypothetical protein
MESRMREIRLSGSGEGAVLSRPYLITRDGTGTGMLPKIRKDQRQRTSYTWIG